MRKKKNKWETTVIRQCFSQDRSRKKLDRNNYVLPKINLFSSKIHQHMGFVEENKGMFGSDFCSPKSIL